MTRVRVGSVSRSRWVAVLVSVTLAVALLFVAAVREEAARNRIHAVLVEDAAQGAGSGSPAPLPGT